MTSLHLSEVHRIRLEQVLSEALPLQEIGTSKLHEAMRYSALAGGKRIRPSLVYASGQALNIPIQALDRIAVAIECIHAYSLVHDDLPAMDDDDLRRGLPTAHKAFGEATAILSGDALQAYAFDWLSEPIEGIKAEHQLKLIKVLSAASGSRGMVGGQAIDLASVGISLTEKQLEVMHAHKTGALINASVMMPSYCNDSVTDEQRTALNSYADAIGLAFQVQDDILDIESDTETLGKQQGSDLAANKPTYPSILGMAGAKQKLESLHDEALTALSGFGSEADLLRNIARFIVKRIK
ncbi:polyprenyl synthetase family protein [Leucothrix arctica]|uniref:Geranyl transferase n=1 Tax=Leucothrix arctica TaxID=1481894 RepID=A0A317CJM8_9GAMM|nr:farnesyl diphosphate synthase [Leucothrix arctica]PWQ98784.1 geranyl transferase [Leucothrix arctica]